MYANFKHTDAEGHHVVELPSERVKVVTAILLNVNLSIVLHEASLDGGEICVFTLFINAGLEHSLHSEFLRSINGERWAWAESFAVNFSGRSLALALLVASTIEAWLRLDFEASFVSLHEVDGTALRSSTSLISIPAALFVVETSQVNASGASAADLTDVNIELD